MQGIDGKPAHGYLKLEEVLACVEKFYSPEQRLDSKLHSKELFEQFLAANPQMTPTRNTPLEVAEGEEIPHHVLEERRKHEDEEMKAARQKWRKQLMCEHLVFLKGVELVYFEFREVLFDLAIHRLPRDLVDPKRTGKVKGVIIRFLEDCFIKRIGALMRHSKNDISNTAVGASLMASAAARIWPETEKDKAIRLRMEERRRQEEEERLAREERERQEVEMQQMSREDTPALDEDQMVELRLRQQEEEETRKRENQQENPEGENPSQEVEEDEAEEENEAADDEEAAEDDEDY